MELIFIFVCMFGFLNVFNGFSLSKKNNMQFQQLKNYVQSKVYL